MPSGCEGPGDHCGRTASFELWVTPDRERDASDPAIRDRMAETRALQVRAASRIGGQAGLRIDALPEDLWPEPHNNLFDFGATSGGAEWTDDRARAARALLDRLPHRMVPGHMDWSAKHFRFFDHGEVAMVYDWDSLRLCEEARVVGGAAATFTLRFEPEPTSPPVPEEARAFVSAHERASAAPFAAAEGQQVSAAALYALAYEHAIGAPGGRPRGPLSELAGPGYFAV